MKVTDKITITNECNMELMKRYPDNYFDLAIVDPPYGISINANMGIKKGGKKRHNKVEWGNEIPSSKYWEELLRVSKNQVVWGGNYFPQIWKNGCSHFIFWDKLTPQGMSFSDGELAWTSYNRANRKIVLRNITGDKIHPTEKPSELYKRILKDYAKQGDKILDTHIGSMSIAIACHDMGFELTGCELDSDYYTAGIESIKRHVSQLSLFEPEELTQTKQTLF